MIIESERSILRPFIKSDAKDVFKYLKEPLSNCFMCMKLNTLDDSYKLMKKCCKDIEFSFAVVLKSENIVIGEIDTHPESVSPEDNSVLETFSLCLMLKKISWICLY